MTIRGVRSALLGTTALAMTALAGPALAACLPSVPASGQTVTCSGVDTDGVDGGAATQVTVNVLAGATVNPAVATTSIAVGGSSVVNNAGAIVNVNVLAGFDTVGIDLSPGTGSVATNTGTIAATMDAGDMAAVGIRTGNGNTAVNSGTIQATATNSFSSAAIAIGGGAAGGSGNVVTNTGTLLATGSLIDQASGIVLLDSNVITNSGSIVASGTDVFAAFAIQLGDFNTVSNSGTVSGLAGGLDEGRGIVAGSSNAITNTGTIIATTGDCCGIGVEVLDSNTITNTGTITGIATGLGQGIGVSLGDANTLVNAGTISGVTAEGLAFGVANFFTVSAGNTIVNNGTITATVTGSGQAIGLAVFALSTITNNGTIEAIATAGGASTAVSLFTSNVVTNTATGRIIANSPAGTALVLGPANTVANQGVVAANGAGGIAIELDDAGNVVTNTGLIQAIGAGGLALLNCACGSDTTVANSGTIDGQIDLSGGSNNVVTNSGLITISTPGAGVTHAITGTLTQTASGTLALRVDGAGGADRLAVAGPANLGGTLRAAVQPGLYTNTQTYVGVIAGTIAGTFASAVSTSPFLAASAAYFPGNVDLTLTRVPFGAVPGATDNQRAVGNALEAGYSPAATGNAATIYSGLFAATSVSVLDSLSGEIGTGVQNPSFAMGDAFLRTLLGQAQRWRAGAMSAPQGSAAFRVQFAATQPTFGVAPSYAQGTTPGAASWPPRSVGPHWAAWASGYGLGGNRDGDGTVGSARLGYSMGGAAAGADVQLAPNLLVGGAVGAGGSYFSLDERASKGDARTIFFGLYGSWTMGPLYVDAAVSYGHGEFSTTRTIVLGQVAELANGSFDGNQYGGRFEAGWRFTVQRYELTPFAALSVQALRQSGYSESTTNLATSQPGILGLSYRGETTTSVRSFLGGQAASTYRLDERTTVSPRIRLAWAHEFSADRQVNASFLTIPGAAFTVAGARPARDAVIVGAGVDLGIGRNVTLYAQFDGDIDGDGSAYAGSGGLRIAW